MLLYRLGWIVSYATEPFVDTSISLPMQLGPRRTPMTVPQFLTQSFLSLSLSPSHDATLSTISSSSLIGNLYRMGILIYQPRNQIKFSERERNRLRDALHDSLRPTRDRFECSCCFPAVVPN
jgi:hypothetical protein